MLKVHIETSYKTLIFYTDLDITTAMWHEARKQERMIRGLIVDYRRRAERRKDFYEKIVRILVLFVMK